MFTGLISGVGAVRRLIPLGAGHDMRLEIGSPWPDAQAIPIGASAETLSKTNLGAWTEGTRINLERSLRLGDELGGHLVSGHVDGLGRVQQITPENGSYRIAVEVPKTLARFIAAKGSVAVDGVSLTVNDVSGTRFGVNIIPHTWAVTTLGQLAPGGAVHIEIDMLARYVARLSEPIEESARENA